ncbi:MAG TPA: biopolymer transporter ExbD [Candidatus Eisenbacteria bacterium]
MGAVDSPESGGKKKKKGGLKKRAPKRIGVKIDMTPMVDVAFLLLIFFMCTTVFRKPQALEINLPPDPKAKVEIAESNVMTVRAIAPADKTRGEIRVFWNIAKAPYKEQNWNDMEAVFAAEGKKNPKLVVLVKIDRTVKYKYMVNLIDQLQFAELNRFSLAPLEPKEKAEVEAL